MSFHSGQKKIIENAKRFNVVACGRRFGKTAMGAVITLTGWPGCFKGLVNGYDVGWFAPNYKLLDDAWRSIKHALTAQGMIVRADSQQHRIETIFKSSIDFWTMEDKDSGRGRKYGLVIVDEAAMARYLEECWEQAVRPTLTDYSGGAWFFSTPKGINYFHKLHSRGLSEDWQEWVGHHAPTTANPYIDPGEVEDARRSLPELVFKQEYLAEFVTFGAGLVKPDYLIPGESPAELPVVLGVDLAISEKQSADYSSIAALSRHQASGMVYIREIERFRGQFNDVLNRIIQAANRHKAVIIAVEQTQYQAAVIQELTRTTKLPVRGIRPDKDKLTRFMPILTRFEQNMVRYDPNIPRWYLDELLAFPEGEHDDGVDATSIAFNALPSVEYKAPDYSLTVRTSA